jgi:hypothetical protein
MNEDKPLTSFTYQSQQLDKENINPERIAKMVVNELFKGWRQYA